MTTLEESCARTCEEHWFTTGDGTQLFYRRWPAAKERATRAVILFHRGPEHSGRLQHLVEGLALSKLFEMFAWDARGPNSNATNPNLGTFVQDVDCFARHISETYGIAIEDIAVLAHSVGGVVLAAPAFKVKWYVPFARTLLGLGRRLFGEFRVNSYVQATALTHDPADGGPFRRACRDRSRRRYAFPSLRS
jgi:alpha-beta hydrolase superfamily lysophospholipase